MGVGEEGIIPPKWGKKNTGSCSAYAQHTIFQKKIHSPMKQWRRLFSSLRNHINIYTIVMYVYTRLLTPLKPQVVRNPAVPCPARSLNLRHLIEASHLMSWLGQA